MDTSEDMPATQEKRRRAEDLHLAFVADKEIVEEHEQWRGPGMRALWEAATASALEGVRAATSAWAEDQRKTTLGQELTAGEERTHGALVRGAKDRDLGDWGKFTVFEPARLEKPPKGDRGYALGIHMEFGRRQTGRESSLGGQRREDPNLKTDLVETSGCVRLRSSPLQSMSLSAPGGWKLWSLVTKNAFLQADGFEREV